MGTSERRIPCPSGSLSSGDRQAAVDRLIPADGLLVACADDPNVRGMIHAATSPVETYGVQSPADWTITTIQCMDGGTAFTVACRGTNFGALHTMLIGRHNRLNLLGATVERRFQRHS